MSSTRYGRRGRAARRRRGLALLAAGFLTAAPALSTVLAAPADAAVGTLSGTGISSPGGAVFLPDAAGGGHLWVADHLQGFCQVAGGGIVTSTCFTGVTSPGQPAFDAARNLVYLPDNGAKSAGVVRLSYDPATESFTDAAVLAPQAGLSGNRPTAAALGPDGSLYIGFLKNGNVSQVKTPAAASQLVQSVGSTSDSKSPRGGFAFRNGDLYIAEGAAVTRMAVAGCTGGCRASAVLGLSVASPLSITYDGGLDRFFIGTLNSVVRFAAGTRVQQTLANSGTYPDGTVVPLANVSTVALLPGDGLAVGDDTTGGTQVLTGRLWNLPASGAAVGGGGTPPPPPPPPPPAATTTATQVATGLTAPAGALWLPNATGGGHVWVADHLRGLCMVDPSTQSLVAASCNAVASSPGQPSFDAARNVVYVPDNAAKSIGVVRLDWDPATETFVGDTVLAASTGLSGNRPTTTALGPDGNLYVGFLKNGNVTRVRTPEAATQITQSVGSTSDARRPGGFAFRGNDLVIAEGAAVTRIANAASATCTGGCRATAIGVTRATAPLSVAYDVARDRLYVGDATAGVVSYAFANRAQTVLANTGTLAGGSTDSLANVSALALDGAGQTLFLGDDPTAGGGNLAGRFWQVALA